MSGNVLDMVEFHMTDLLEFKASWVDMPVMMVVGLKAAGGA